ncbi:MAG: tetratricopeptide repeat protein [candidate division WOR-3 bacterium]
MTYLRRSILTIVALWSITWAQSVPLDALLRGGRIHYQGGRYERAREQFQKALEQYGTTADNTTLANIHLWLGMCDAQLNQLSPAAEHFLTALERDSTIAADIQKDEEQSHWVWTALIAASRENLNAGNPQKAVAYARAALLIDPAKSQTYTLIANAYSALGKYEDMLKTAQEMLALNTGSAEAYSLIGLYFLQKPDSLFSKEGRRTRWDSTRYYYQKALDIYQARLDSAQKELTNLLKESDAERVRAIASQLVEKQRYAPPEDLKRYIEKDLGQAKQLTQIAQVTSKMFYASNNINVTAARLGSALLRASAETKGDTSNQYRDAAESYFLLALQHDPYDYTTLFNLGISQYQAKKDSLAMVSFIKVIENTVVPVSRLPEQTRSLLFSQVSAEIVPQGYLEITSPLEKTIDSTLSRLGYKGGGFVYLYFPQLREQKDFIPLTPADTAGIFLSNQHPLQLENIYLLLGVSQTGLGLAFIEGKRKEEGKTLLKQAIANLTITTKINPNNAEAYLNLVHCFRESGDKEKAAWAYEMYKKLSK